jgi:hypothetical protein
MRKIVRNAAELVLLILLLAVVTGIRACVWLPPF